MSINQHFVLLVLHSLQGHPESRKIWMKLIDQILIKDLGSKTTTKDRCILYQEDQRACHLAFTPG